MGDLMVIAFEGASPGAVAAGGASEAAGCGCGATGCWAITCGADGMATYCGSPVFCLIEISKSPSLMVSSLRFDLLTAFSNSWICLNSMIVIFYALKDFLGF